MTENVRDSELRIREQTETEHRDECKLWLEGINLLYASFVPLHKHPFKNHEQEHVMLTTLMHAATTQQSAYLLATTGYCVQALSLTRLGYEDWLTFWHMRNWPEEAELFLKYSEQKGTITIPPKKAGGRPTTRVKSLKVQDMLDRMERKIREHNPHFTQDHKVRAWKDHVNVLAHVGFASIRRSYVVEQRVTNIQLGPRYDKMRFVECVSEFASEIAPLLNATEMYCRYVGVTPANAGAHQTYQDRVLEWQKNVYGPLVGP